MKERTSTVRIIDDCVTVRRTMPARARILVFMVALLTAFVIPPMTSIRAGGVSAFEFGVEDNGMATAGRYAFANDPSTASFNPAGMVRLQGTQYLVSATPLLVSIEYETGSQTSVPGGGGGSDAGGVLPTANFFMSKELTDSVWFGLGFYGGAGLGAEYDDDWAGRYYVTEETMSVLLVNPTIGYKVTDKLSVGGGPAIGWGDLELRAAINNSFGTTVGDPDGELKVEDGQFGFGFNLGILWQSEKTRLGLSYFSQMDLEFEDALGVSGVTNPVLQNLVDSLAGNQLDLEIHMPQSAFFSWYRDITDTFALVGNIGWQEWEEFGYISVSISDPNISDVTADLMFKNTWHGALGARFRHSDTTTWNLGVAYDESPVSQEDRSIVFPLAKQIRISGGLQRTLNSGNQWGVNLTYVSPGTPKSDEEKGVLAGRVQGEFDSLDILSLGFHWIWRGKGT